MYRTTKYQTVRKVGLSAAVAVGAVAAGAGVASATTHHSTRATTHVATRTSKAARAAEPRDAHGVEGVVSAVTSSSITIKDPSGSTTTYAIDSSTTVSKDRSTASAADLAVGERVRIAPSSSSATTAAGIDIELAHLGGQVVSVGGDTIVVTDHEGFQRTIVVSGSTTYTKAGASATLGDVATGSFVFAEGTVDANHTTLDATNVGVGTPPAAAPGGFAGSMGPGPMGMGGDHGFGH
jgi:hypothetical protein